MNTKVKLSLLCKHCGELSDTIFALVNDNGTHAFPRAVAMIGKAIEITNEKLIDVDLTRMEEEDAYDIMTDVAIITRACVEMLAEGEDYPADYPTMCRQSACESCVLSVVQGENCPETWDRLTADMPIEVN